ncbi:MAG: 1-deoxy-D-xylulose-5-phosphate reductoisomerase [Epsilonproteobacteria bacterium]|nr:1-deoxy-D-xylulose-5-phosphate reductoisomerase [Campylobacterota bacterium]
MIVLGSTGSIGVNALNIAKRFNIDIEVLVAGENIDLLNSQIELFSPKRVVIKNKEDISKINHDNVLWGEEGIIEALRESESSLVVNALVGFLGLRPTLEAIGLDKKVALANKESLVVAGSFIDTSKIVPIDSEHFGLWYLLQDREIDRMIITASGGAFRDTPLELIANMTPKEALNHPNWKMGKKITIDSSTMTNKLFELLEARWLFGEGEYDAIIETKSIIHALIDFKDGSTTAHIANADMKLPISYAILDRVDERIVEHVDLVKLGSLEFKEIKEDRYPIWSIKDDILKRPFMGVVVNAANEVAVNKFLENRISFSDISKITLNAYEKFSDITLRDIKDIFEIDKEVRRFCE